MAIAEGLFAGPDSIVPAKFTIPRKREKGLLCETSADSRESKDVQRIVKQSLSSREDSGTTDFNFANIRIVNNGKLHQEYCDWRSEMRSEGYGETDLRTQYCFLAVSDVAEAERMCEKGLQTGWQSLKCLGDPNLGVYLDRHADLECESLLSRRHGNGRSTPDKATGWLIIFLTTRGRVKTVVPRWSDSSNRKGEHLLEPTPNFDCHVPRSVMPTTGDQRSKQAFRDRMTKLYFFEFGEMDMLKRPRQCCPFAVVPVTCTASSKVSSKPAVSSLKDSHQAVSRPPRPRPSNKATPSRDVVDKPPPRCLFWRGPMIRSSLHLLDMDLYTSDGSTPLADCAFGANIQIEAHIKKPVLCTLLPPRCFENVTSSAPVRTKDICFQWLQVRATLPSVGAERDLWPTDCIAMANPLPGVRLCFTASDRPQHRYLKALWVVQEVHALPKTLFDLHPEEEGKSALPFARSSAVEDRPARVGEKERDRDHRLQRTQGLEKAPAKSSPSADQPRGSNLPGGKQANDASWPAYPLAALCPVFDEQTGEWCDVPISPDQDAPAVPGHGWASSAGSNHVESLCTPDIVSPASPNADNTSLVEDRPGRSTITNLCDETGLQKTSPVGDNDRLSCSTPEADPGTFVDTSTDWPLYRPLTGLKDDFSTLTRREKDQSASSTFNSQDVSGADARAENVAAVSGPERCSSMPSRAGTDEQRLEQLPAQRRVRSTGQEPDDSDPRRASLGVEHHVRTPQETVLTTEPRVERDSGHDQFPSKDAFVSRLLRTCRSLADDSTSTSLQRYDMPLVDDRYHADDRLRHDPRRTRRVSDRHGSDMDLDSECESEPPKFPQREPVANVLPPHMRERFDYLWGKFMDSLQTEGTEEMLSNTLAVDRNAFGNLVPDKSWSEFDKRSLLTFSSTSRFEPAGVFEDFHPDPVQQASMPLPRSGHTAETNSPHHRSPSLHGRGTVRSRGTDSTRANTSAESHEQRNHRPANADQATKQDKSDERHSVCIPDRQKLKRNPSNKKQATSGQARPTAVKRKSPGGNQSTDENSRPGTSGVPPSKKWHPSKKTPSHLATNHRPAARRSSPQRSSTSPQPLSNNCDHHPPGAPNGSSALSKDSGPPGSRLSRANEDRTSVDAGEPHVIQPEPCQNVVENRHRENDMPWSEGHCQPQNNPQDHQWDDESTAKPAIKRARRSRGLRGARRKVQLHRGRSAFNDNPPSHNHDGRPQQQVIMKWDGLRVEDDCDADFRGPVPHPEDLSNPHHHYDDFGESDPNFRIRFSADDAGTGKRFVSSKHRDFRDEERCEDWIFDIGDSLLPRNDCGPFPGDDQLWLRREVDQDRHWHEESHRQRSHRAEFEEDWLEYEHHHGRAGDYQGRDRRHEEQPRWHDDGIPGHYEVDYRYHSENFEWYDAPDQELHRWKEPDRWDVEDDWRFEHEHADHAGDFRPRQRSSARRRR